MWSHHHRAALVRVGPQGAEFRGADPAANPYLLVAGLLIAGAAGAAADLQLGPAQDESLGGFDVPSTKDLYLPLPRSLDEAVDALVQDDELTDGLDNALLERYVDGLRFEAERVRQHVTRWERDLSR
jgi:glutamine synthetase